MAASFSSPFQAVETSTFALWGDSALPAVQSFDDPASVEVGVRFSSDVKGQVSGIRFFKGAGNTGTHSGSLWALDGTLLATATFTAETDSGWQQVSFATPVDVVPNTTYVASYFAPTGHYAADKGYFFGHGVDNGPLHAPADAAGAGNGLFAYSATSVFPGNSVDSNNYWVSPVFTVPPSNTQPVAQAVAVNVAEDGVAAVQLAASDRESPTSQLKFQVLSLPSRGVLKAGGVTVAVGQTFTGVPANLTYEAAAELDGAGSDSFTFNVTDPQGLVGATPATVSIAVSEAVAPGTAVLGADRVLRVAGTSGADLITVSPNSLGKLRVTLGLSVIADNIPLANVGEIRIWGRDGNDAIAVVGVTTKCFIHGGAGNDAIAGADGDDLLLGGLGDDALVGMSGNDVIVGGDGRDALAGMNGHDILVAGQIANNLSAAALRAMGAEWVASKATTSAEAADADRAVTDDDADVLSGGAGCDWFILSLGDVALDVSHVAGNADVITYVS